MIKQEVAGDAANNVAIEDLSTPAVKIICRICFSGENEGSTSANKMVPCKTCNKKYHRSCLKVWAEYRGIYLLVFFLPFDPLIVRNNITFFFQTCFTGIRGHALRAALVRLAKPYIFLFNYKSEQVLKIC